MSDRLKELSDQLHEYAMQVQVPPRLLQMVAMLIIEAREAAHPLLLCNTEGCEVKVSHMHMPSPSEEQKEFVKKAIEKGALKDLPIEELPKAGIDPSGLGGPPSISERLAKLEVSIEEVSKATLAAHEAALERANCLDSRIEELEADDGAHKAHSRLDDLEQKVEQLKADILG